MTGLGLFIYGITLGIAFCAPPGAVTMQSFQRGVARGFRGAFSVQLGSLIGDAFWAIFALAGLSFLVQNTAIRVALGLVGTILLLKLAWSSVQDARRGTSIEPSGSESASTRSDFTVGVAMSMTNPWAVAFWVGLGSALTAAGISQPTAADFAVFLGGFMFGALLWAVGISVAIAWGRRYLTPFFFRAVNALCGLGLAFFGISLFGSILASLLPQG